MCRVRCFVILALAFDSVSCIAYADDGHHGEHLFTNQIAAGRKIQKPWDAVVGQQVVVEGLAWGAFRKGLGSHVILDGAKVYVRNVDFVRDKLNGKPVRVIGTLRRRHMPKASQTIKDGRIVVFTQGYMSSFDYYFIDSKSIKVIERVKNPWMRELELLTSLD